MASNRRAEERRQRRQAREHSEEQNAAMHAQAQHQAQQELIERSWKDGFIVGYSVAVEEVERGNVIQAIATALLAKVTDRYQGAAEIAKSIQRAMRPSNPDDLMRGVDTAFRARFPATEEQDGQMVEMPPEVVEQMQKEGQDGSSS